MKIKCFISVFVTLSFLYTHMVQATLIRVSDGVEVSDLASESTTVWELSSDGHLLSAYNVKVAGNLYHVVFEDGTFMGVFDDTDDLEAVNKSQAEVFANALLESVFLNASGYLMDDAPELTNGCPNPIDCNVWTPYLNELDGKVYAIIATNYTEDYRPDETYQSIVHEFNDFSDSANSVYANWQLQSVSGPSTVVLMLISIVGLLIGRRKFKSLPPLFSSFATHSYDAKGMYHRELFEG